MIVLLFILPRLTDSLHPGNGGNPGFNKYDMDNQMRMVFYPAVIGWILMGVWVMQIRVRLLEITNQILEN
jgi:heme exporter protein C